MEDKKSNYLQIGPPKLITKFFELTIEITETGNLCSIISPNEIGTPLKIQFHIMGVSLFSNEFYGFDGILNKETFKVQIKSEIEFLSAYFKQFPSLTYCLVCGDKLIGSGSMDLHDLTDLREHFTASTKQKIILRSSDGKHLLVADCLRPYLKVEITLLPVLGKNENNPEIVPTNQNISIPIISKVHQAPILTVEPQDKSSEMKLHSPEPVIEEQAISCNDDTPIPQLSVKESEIHLNDHQLPSPITSTPAQSPDPVASVQVLAQNNTVTMIKEQEASFAQATQYEDLNSSPNSVKAVDRCINVNLFQQNGPVGPFHSNINDILPKAYVQELATKYIEELEDWKEQQQEMFKFELKRKSDKHLNRLSLEWSKRKETMENELAERLENCHLLKIKLEDVLMELELKWENLSKSEQELQFGKNELDKRYTMKFRELRRASRQHQSDMEEKFKQSNVEKAELLRRLAEKDTEIAKLNRLLSTETEARLTVEESKKLLAEKENLMEKLEKAVESKVYYKDQCCLAIRQIHDMKKQKMNNENWLMQKDREGVEIIGMLDY